MMPLSYVLTLSHARRNFIVEHIDGPRRALASDATTRGPLFHTKIICSCDEGGVRQQTRQLIKFTMLTDIGRDVLAQILADYAEKLIRAGCLDPDAVPVTIIPYAVETAETRRYRGALIHNLVVKERTPT